MNEALLDRVPEKDIFNYTPDHYLPQAKECQYLMF